MGRLSRGGRAVVPSGKARPGQPRRASVLGGEAGRGLFLELQVSRTPLMYGVTRGHKPGPRWSGKARQGSWESYLSLSSAVVALCPTKLGGVGRTGNINEGRWSGPRGPGSESCVWARRTLCPHPFLISQLTRTRSCNRQAVGTSCSSWQWSHLPVT